MTSGDSVSSSGSVSADHQGRTRSFEHVPGNWASHVLVPCNVKSNGLIVLFHKLQFVDKSRKLPHTMCCRKLLDTICAQQTYRKLFKNFCSQHLCDKLVKGTGRFSVMIQIYFLAVDLPDSFPTFITSLQKLWSSEASKLHICNTNDFHVSISRTVPIRHHWIEPLKQLLQSGLHGKRKYVLWESCVNIIILTLDD